MVGWYKFYSLHEKRPRNVLLLRKQAASVILSITSRQMEFGRREQYTCISVSCQERDSVSGHGCWEGARVGARFLHYVSFRNVNSWQHLFVNWERRNSAVFLNNADGSFLATPGETRTVKTRRKPSLCTS
jgi:hypothetical protein